MPNITMFYILLLTNKYTGGDYVIALACDDGSIKLF